MQGMETAYVENGVSAENASTTVGIEVIKAVARKYQTNNQIGKATIEIDGFGSLEEVTGDATVSVCTTDFEVIGTISLDDGILTWGGIEPNVPAEVARVELYPTTLEIEKGKSKTVEVKCYNSSNELIPTRKLKDISITRKSGSEKITVIPDSTNRNKVTINVAKDQEIGNNIAVITATVGNIEAVAEKRCTINVQDYYITDDYTWQDLSEIAKLISDQYESESNSISNTNESATVTYNSKQVTLNVGDKAKLKYNGNEKEVRILGFNHDDLENFAAKAGISFEFVDCLGTSSETNQNNLNAGGWKSYIMRTTLNTTYLPYLTDLSSASVQLSTSIIKSVKKPYLSGSKANSATIPTEGDQLWLFSTAELWGSKQKANAMEGNQYKLYANGQSKVKKYDNSDVRWWLRSPDSSGAYFGFCWVSEGGACKPKNETASYGIAPGFSI